MAIVDDHRLLRAGLTQLLRTAGDIDVVGSACNGREAVDLVDALAPDVVLMDLSMPEMDGIAATRAVRRRAPDTQVVVLTSFADHDRILEALDAGATGYLLKESEPEELLRGVRAAALGESPLAPKAARALLESRRATQPRPVTGAELSEREHQILALVGQGLPNKVIAVRLGIAEQTVKNHLSRIFLVLGVTDRTQAALHLQRRSALM